MASKMLSKKSTKPSAPCDFSTQLTELQTKVKKLQAELEAERTKVKQLRREKNLESRQIREQEQNNARIALKDLKSKFTVARQRELEIQKDTLNRRYEAEIVKLRKQKDGEIAKLRNNLRKCQNELTEAIHCLANSAQHHGLSGAARASSTFESERAKLLAEVQELTSSKRHLEDVVKTLTESERHKTHSIKTLEERLKSDVDKFKKEADIEAIRLLDELKSKDRQIAQLEKDISVRDGQITKLRHEIEANMDQTKRNNELMRRFATRGLSKKADSLSSLESSSSDSGADLNGPPTENEHQIQHLQEQIRSFKEQNQQLTSRLKDVEDKQKPLHEKARKFLEKNMEQTALNRDLEDRIKVLNDNNNKLQAEVDQSTKEKRRLSEELNKEKTDKTLINELETQVEELRSELADQEDVISALQHACTEKDRRLELLSHRRRKQRNSRSQQKVVRFLLPDQVQLLAAGIKETYFGYDEDRASVDSEGSSRISLDATLDEDIFDEITREECEKNYQRLAREHLELERSYALLQNQAALSPTNASQIKELGWTDDEKLDLEKTVQKLQDKLTETENKLEKTSTQLNESREQHDDLEFQLLELQEAHDKLLQESEETKSELSFHREESEGSPREQPGALESKNEELRKKIHKLQRSASQEATTEERALLLQAKILLDVSDKKIKELVVNEETLNSRVRKLEEERVTLLSQSAGEPEQLVLEYEQVRNELHTVKQENEKLKETNIILESQNQDLSYQIEDWAVINKMDSTEKSERPVSELLEEEIKALKYGEDRLTEQNARLSKELSKVRQELDATKDELIAANLEVSKSGELKEENLKLSQELSAVKDELKAVQEKLSSASVERSMEARATRLSLDDDLVEDNQRLRAEIFSLQEQLKSFESQSPVLSDSADVTSPEHRIKVLEKEIADLKHHNEQLKEKLKEREKDVLKSREVVVSIETDLTDLEKENDELRDKLDDLETEDDNEVAALRVKVRALERSARMLQEQLEATGGDVSTSIEDVIEELEQEKDKVAELRKHMDRMAEDLVELEALKGQVAELESVRHDLKEKLEKLKHLQELADSETEIVTEQEVEAVRAKKSDDSSDDEQRKDMTDSLRAVQAENKSLQAKIEQLEMKLEEAEERREEHVEKLTDDKNKRIEILENELAKLQANEDTLNDTIEELREVENVLRTQVSKYEDSASDSDKSDDKLEALQLDLTKLHDTNSSLLSQIAEMTETERSLREQLSNTEDSFKSQLAELQQRLVEKETGDSSGEESDKPSVDESGDKKSSKSKLVKLEARVQELAARESDLMEQVYAMKLENQELQEHVEVLQGDSESARSSEAESPRYKEDKSKDDIIENLKSNIKELEAEKSQLKDDLLKAKLESVETLKESQELQLDAGQVKALQDQINELEKSEACLKKELKEMEEKTKELESSESSLKVEMIRLREFEAKAKEHEVCENRLRDAAEKVRELEKKVDNMNELEKELSDLRNQKVEFEREREAIVTASVVGPLGSVRKISASSESETDENKENEKLRELTSKVKELEVTNKEQEGSANTLKEEIERLRQNEEQLTSEIEKLKKYEALYSTERAEVELAAQNEGQIEVQDEKVGIERVERELTDQQEDKIHVAVEQQAVLATVNVGSVDRKRRSPKSSESDAEEVKELTLKVKELESQLEEIPELRAQLDKLKEHNDALIEKLTKMKLHIDEMEAEERDLHEQLRKRKGLQAQLQEMEAQFATQNEQLLAYHKAVEAEKSKLKEDREELKKSLDVMEGERDELKAKLVMAKEEANGTIAKLEKFNESFQEMEDDNKKLKDENEELASQMKDLNEIVTLSDELRAQNTSLQNEYDEFKIKFEDVVVEKENLEKSEKELKANVAELQDKCQQLEEQVQSKSDTEVKLFEKIELLVESEGRLMEKLEETEEEEDTLREENDKLKEEIEKLKRMGMSAEAADKDMSEKIEKLEKKERDLKEQITVLETKKEELEEKLEDAKKAGNEELVKLREKVDILLDTEEKLMDRLQEQEEVELKLREKIDQLEENEKEMRVQLVTVKEREEVRARSSSKSSVETDSDSSKSLDQIKELEQSEKVLKQRINELEKSEAILSTQNQGLEKTLETLAKSETDLRDRLKETEQDHKILQLKYDEIGKMEIALHTKVKDLQDQNRDLLNALKDQQKSSETHYHITQSLESKPKDFVSSSEEEMIVPESVVTIAAAPPGGRRSPERLVTSGESSIEEQIVAASRDIRPEVAHLYDLSKDELVSRLHESEQKEEFHRDQIRELSDDLSQFRQAVGAVAGEHPEERRTKESRQRSSRLHYSDDYAEERDSGLESLQLSFTMLDSPEAILKQRISELEKMEQHHKQQIIELEKDREELHEIARHDKNHIHELSVQNREYELSDKNLKDQINRLEASETQLQLQVDDLTDKIEELEEQIKNMKLAEKQLRTALTKTENNETELTVKLENAQGDVQHTTNKWKKKVSEIEGDKVSLSNKVEDLTLRVSDLEGSELTLKRKLKKATDSDEANKEKLTQLEESESFALSRVHELEAVNEALSQKLHKLEEEKASLLYELSDLETTHIDGHDTVHKLKSSQRRLLVDLAKREDAGSLMQKKLREYMQRENELEDELEKYQKLEKQWNEKREKMQAKIDSLSAKVQELEALIASNETKVSFVNDLEKENAILHRNLAHQQKTIQQSDQEIHKLQDRIMQYEYSSANNALATIPKVELADLRTKAKLLEEAEEKIAKLEKLEKHLRECIEKLRDGKDAHGYELEIAEMKEKVNKYNQVVQDSAGLQWALTSTKKAHELLKENHDHTKKELKDLREQIQKGDVQLVEETRPESSSKGILARLTHSFTLSEITPELKQALKQLEANHPEAYDEFIRTLHPGAGSMAVLKPSQDVEGRIRIGDDDGAIPEEQVKPVRAVSVSTSRPTESEETKRQGTKHHVYGKIIDQDTEETVWSAIEGPSTKGSGASDEEPLWTNVENAKEDMMLTMVLGDEDGDVIKKTMASSVVSAGSTGSSQPPPLPETIPPELSMRRLDSPGNDSSYYLPSTHESMISADEASEIDEDEVTGLRSQSRTPPRAKSVDRDSVISESLLSTSPSKRMASSMDSIPDSGMGTLHQSEREILKERIMHLEKQLKAKEKELNLAEINKRELDVEETSQTMVELQDKIQRLQEDVKLKDVELESLRASSKDKGEVDPSELQANISVLKVQLEKKEKEMTAKSNSIDTLMKELKEWQETTVNLKEEKKSVEEALKQAERKLEDNKDMGEKYSELQTDFIELQKEYNQLEERLSKTSDSEQTIEELEETVTKLRRQHNDFERLELERQQLESKLKAVEDEFKATKSQNNDIVKENAQLHHKVDLLTRDNKTLQTDNAEYNKLKSKYASMEKSKSEAQNMVTPLRAKVVRLSKTCKDKDNLIEKLANEVRQVNKKSQVVLEADQVISKSSSEEYNRPLTPLNVPSSDEDEMPPLVSASVLQSGTDSNTYGSGVSGPVKKPETSTNQIEALIEQRISNGTQMAPPHMSNGSTHSAVGPVNNVTIDDLVIAPQASLAPVNQLSEEGAHTLPKQKKRSKPEPTLITRSASSTENYRAVKDYNPEHFSRSGHKRLELPLKEGDIVKVLGEIVSVGCKLVLQYMIEPGIFAECSTDDRGYFEAELDGKVGLVPANYLQPVYPARPHRPKSDIVGDKAPEQILSMHADLQRTHVPLHKVPFVSSTYDESVEGLKSGSSSARSSTREGGSSITHPMFLGAPVMPMTRKPKNTRKAQTSGQQPHGYIAHPGHYNQVNGYPLQIATSLPSLPTTSAPTSGTSEANQPMSSKLGGPPSAPMGFHVQRVVGRHSLLLVWKAPLMDELARSNGVPVKGYRLQIDGRDKQDLPSPHLTKALIEHLNLRKAHHFTLQTVSSNGTSSRPVHTNYDGPGRHRGEEEGDSAGDGDVSSIMSGSHNGTGDHDQRVFMAIYNYNPQKQSPKSDTSDELPLVAGDIITTYGPAMPDGFYHARVKGRKGLVPADFIEEIALFRSGSHRSLMSSGGAPISHPMSAASSRPSSSGVKQSKLRS